MGGVFSESAGINRRTAIGGLGLTAALAMTTVAGRSHAAPVSEQPGAFVLAGRTIRFADLTHKLTRAFSFGQIPPRISMEAIDGSGKAVGMNLNRLSLVEHTGTHIDAPRHFSDDGASLGEMPLADLIVPLAVLDLRAKFAASHDAAVEPADIERWEAQHGPLPKGCCVVMWSGIDPMAAPKAKAGPLSQIVGPGFGPEVGRMLMERRAVKGIAVDAMSLDTGPNTPAYPFHQEWLRSGRWGIEGIANLSAVPASGGILIVGAAPVEDATGMPIRAVALF